MTPPVSLRLRLRDATAQAHADLDARLAHAFDDAEGYAAFLRGMKRFVDAAAATTGDARLAAAQAALAADLADVGAEPLPPAAAVRADAAAATGWRYVAAGASLGARVLLPRAHALGFEAGFGARYLALQAGGDAWRDLRAELEAMRPGAEARAAEEGACAAFACARGAMGLAFDRVPA